VTAPEPTLRAVSLTNYVAVARFAGLDPGAMLLRAGLSPKLSDDPDLRIPARPVVKLFANSAELSGFAGFGLLMAECRTLSTLGPASLLLRHQPTVGAMMKTAIRAQRHFSDVVHLALEDDGETAILRWDFLPEFAEPQWVEYSVAIAMHSFSEATRGRWHPENVHFTHLQPHDVTWHKRVFQCELEFDADCIGLSFPTAMLDVPNVLANPPLAVHAERLLGMVPTGRPVGSVTERARHAIFLLVHSGGATVEKVGETLGLHPRALQRLLGREGWTFAQLLNETRRELAQRYLIGAHHSLATISHLAGYSSQSAFTRWFVGEFGQSPMAWREQAGRRAGT